MRTDLFHFPSLEPTQRSAYQSCPNLVLCLHVSLVGPRSRHSQPIRDRPARQDRGHKEAEETGEELNGEASLCQYISQGLPSVTPEVPGIDVLVRPQSRVRGHREVYPSPRTEVIPNRFQELAVVGDVLDHIEQSDGGQARTPESGILEPRTHHLSNSAVLCISCAGRAGFYQHHLEARILHGPGDETISATDIEYRTMRRILFYRLENAGVAVPKPERDVFQLEARLVAPLRIRNPRSRLRAPDALRGLFEIPRDSRQIDHFENALS